jgi:DNA-binding CsgD family transcriptional regulator
MRLQARTPKNPALLHLSGTRPQDEMGAFGPLPTLIATFFLCAQKNAVDPYVVGVAFGLSPAEAKVATAIAEGASVKAIARKHQTSEFTVRTQLRSVFEKIGVHRQAELTQILVGNPAFWAQSLVR